MRHRRYEFNKSFKKEIRDSPLLQEGHLEAQAFGKAWEHKKNVDVVFVSTQARAIMTLSNIWRKEIVEAGFKFPEEWGKDDFEDGRIWDWTKRVPETSEVCLCILDKYNINVFVYSDSNLCLKV